MTTALTYSLAGMQAAQDRVAIRANNIANVQTPGYRAAGVNQEATANGPVVTPRSPIAPVAAEPVSGSAAAYASPLSPATAQTAFENPSDVSLERELVDMTMAKHAYKASALVTRTAGDMQDALLDMFS